MGNGSMHGKEARRTERPPKGSLIIGEGGRIETYQGEDNAKAKRKSSSKAKKKRTARKA